jgi:hypothetical protein
VSLKEWFAMGWPLISVTLLSLTTAIYLALRLWRTRDFHPTVEINKEGNWLLFNLALVNNSLKNVWVEECVVLLSEFNGIPSKGFEATCKGVLSIREFVEASETLRTGLCQTVYDAAGRPQDEYSFVICGTLKCGIENIWCSQPLPPRRVRMRGLHPIEVRNTRKRPTANSGDSKSRRLISVNRPQEAQPTR